MVEVKVLMALGEGNVVISKEGAINGEWVKISMRKCDIRNPIGYLDSGCSRHMTSVKSYLHKYVEQPGPKVMFGDDSTCTTKGYGSIKCNGIVFTKVAFVNGLKYNLISISQLCDAKYIVQFDKKKGTIFNSNKEFVMIAPRIHHYEKTVGNKMHKAFPLLVRKFPLSEGTSHCLKKNATSRGKVLPLPEVCTAVIVKEKPPSTTTSSTTSGDKSRRTVTLTTKDVQKKKNDVKARTTLLLSLPDEHQLRFSQLQFMGVEVEQDDLKQKFLTSLAPEWLMHTIVWRNKSDLDTMSLNDLYNHLKVYEAEV
nr:retrovirus-related Pol polyprotein from transposon TNT 1-94 [Tanacetum cinerariifolium]